MIGQPKPFSAVLFLHCVSVHGNSFFFYHGKQVQPFLTCFVITYLDVQGSHRLEKYLNIQGCLVKSLKIQSALKSTELSLKGLEFYYLL